MTAWVRIDTDLLESGGKPAAAMERWWNPDRREDTYVDGPITWLGCPTVEHAQWLRNDVLLSKEAGFPATAVTVLRNDPEVAQ